MADGDGRPIGAGDHSNRPGIALDEVFAAEAVDGGNARIVADLLNDVVESLISSDNERTLMSADVSPDENMAAKEASQDDSLTRGDHPPQSRETADELLDTNFEPPQNYSRAQTSNTKTDERGQQVTELLMEVVDLVGCCNFKEQLEPTPTNNFVTQRNYIPEHLLHNSGSSSDSSSDSTDSSSSVDDSSSDSSDDSDDEPIRRTTINRLSCNNRQRMKTKGEFDLADLPPIENLQISVDRSEVQDIGRVLSIVDCLVVVQSFPDRPALNLDTVLFFEGGEPLGQIFDVFGPVVRPLYSVRFNTVDDIKAKNIVVGSAVFYAPKKTEFTAFVFAEQLRRMKGSDASWENNNEPPEKFLDYSDDEQEKKAKARMKNRERKDDGGGDDNNDDGDVDVVKLRSKHHQNQRGRGRRGGFQSNISEASSSPTIRPVMFQPTTGFSRPPPRFLHQYGHEQQQRTHPTFGIPFHRQPTPSYPMYAGGPFSRPPPPQFNPRLPPPQFNPRFPPPPPMHRPRLNPYSSQVPISSLFTDQSSHQTQRIATSSSSSSNILPNPFRPLSNENISGSQTVSEGGGGGGGDTAGIPRFPPVGFIPRL